MTLQHQGLYLELIDKKLRYRETQLHGQVSHEFTLCLYATVKVATSQTDRRSAVCYGPDH